MTDECPLPIDWLDYVESGRREPALTTHLQVCLSCQSLVGGLSATGRPRLAGYSTVAWRPQARPEAKRGDIWITTSSFEAPDVSYHGMDRLFLVVLGSATEIGPEHWYHVMPLWTDVELADDRDLILFSGDNTLDSEWRVFGALQGLVHRSQLEGWVGELTVSGRTYFDEYFSGAISLDRIGTRILDDSDPRLHAAEWVSMTMDAIQQGAVALMKDVREVTISGELRHPQGGVIRLDAHVRRVQVPPESPSRALAAKSSRPTSHIVLEGVGHGIIFEGTLELNVDRSSLVLTVKRVEGWNRPLRAEFLGPHERKMTTGWFEPAFGRKVPVLESTGVFPMSLQEPAWSAWIVG